MMSKWRKGAGLGLLLLLLAGLAAPAAAVLASHSCCEGMAGAADRSDEAPARCQWMAPTSCCDESALAGAAAAFAPVPPAACVQATFPPRPRQHWLHTPAAPPTSQAAALATTVLRL